MPNNFYFVQWIIQELYKKIYIKLNHHNWIRMKWNFEVDCDLVIQYYIQSLKLMKISLVFRLNLTIWVGNITMRKL